MEHLSESSNSITSVCRESSAEEAGAPPLDDKWTTMGRGRAGVGGGGGAGLRLSRTVIAII